MTTLLILYIHIRTGELLVSIGSRMCRFSFEHSVKYCFIGNIQNYNNVNQKFRIQQKFCKLE